MTAPITAPLTAGLAWPIGQWPAPPPHAATGFAELLQQSLEQVQGMNAEAQSAVQQSLIGDDLSMIETFTAVREADLAVRLMLQIRNKLVDAYQELQQLRF
jgi:flagellar hook-basal body complex protein FliE